MSTLEAKSLTKRFGNVTALEDVSFSVAEREFVVLVGPSGCGKSTLLRLIAGLERISAGELAIDGEIVNAVPASKRGLAMVFQSYALYPHMTVAQNMSVGLRISGASKDVIGTKVSEAARILQIETLLDRLPRQLSGGQRQRVAIGRAIVRDPKIFLFDEPLSNLDAALRLQMRLEIAKLHRQLDATMIYVTHDQIEAMTLADKIIVLDEGRIVQSGSPLELYMSPRNKFVAGFIGSPQMNFLTGRVKKIEGGSATIELDCGVSTTLDVEAASPGTGDKVTVGVRPENAEIARDGHDGHHPLEATVIAVEQLGAQTIVYVTLRDGTPFTITEDGMSGFQAGEDVRIRLQEANLHLFDGAGENVRRNESI